MKHRDRRLRLRRLIRGSGGVWGRRRPLWVRLLPAVLVPVLLAVPLIERCRPLLLTFAESEALWIAERTANTAAERVIADNADLCAGMIRTTYTDAQKLSSVVTDASAVNRLKTAIGSAIMQALDGMTGISVAIPLGTVLGWDLLSGWGPLIRFPMSVTSSVFTTVSSSLEGVGINQTAYRVTVGVRVSLYIVTPGGRTTATLDTAFSAAEAVLLGDVPDALTEVFDDESNILGKIFDYGAER